MTDKDYPLPDNNSAAPWPAGEAPREALAGDPAVSSSGAPGVSSPGDPAAASPGGSAAAPPGGLPEIERLLVPVSQVNPAGECLRYEGTWDAIRSAREEEDPTLPQGVWARETKRADWERVRHLCVAAIEKRSKDLQIAMWLLESLLHLRGFSGAREGLALVAGLIREFWEELHPAMEEGDVEARLSPLVWMNEKLSLALKFVPITRPSDQVPGYHFAHWEKVGAEGGEREGEGERREDEGITRPVFLKGVMFTPIAFYRELTDDIGGCVDTLDEISRFLGEKLGADAPGLSGFRDGLTVILHLCRRFLDEKLEKEGPPRTEAEEGSRASQPEASPDEGYGSVALSIRTRAEAYRMLSDAADYLMIHEPHSPTPYLVRRAVSWGDMPLTELLGELVNDDHNLKAILGLLGLRGQV